MVAVVTTFLRMLRSRVDASAVLTMVISVVATAAVAAPMAVAAIDARDDTAVETEVLGVSDERFPEALVINRQSEVALGPTVDAVTPGDTPEPAPTIDAAADESTPGSDTPVDAPPTTPTTASSGSPESPERTPAPNAGDTINIDLGPLATPTTVADGDSQTDPSPTVAPNRPTASVPSTAGPTSQPTAATPTQPTTPPPTTPPTATPRPTVAPTATPRPTTAPTATPRPTTAPPPTLPPAPPTATPRPTATATPIPTQTVRPTATPIATPTTPPIVGPNVAVVLATSPTFVPGQQTYFEVEIRNDGPASASAAFVRFTSNGGTLNSVSGPGWVCGAEGSNAWSCSRSVLSRGINRLGVIVTPLAGGPAPLTVQASLSIAEPEPATADNNAFWQFDVETSPI